MVNNKENDKNKIILAELFFVIREGKWFILMLTTIFFIGSYIYTSTQHTMYKSQAILEPFSAINGEVSGLSSKFGGLANIGGLKFGGVDPTILALTIIKSHQFCFDFIQKNNILPDLIAAEKYNPVNKKIEYDSLLYNKQTNNVVRAIKEPFEQKTSLGSICEALSEVVNIDTSAKHGLITISVEHLSPFIAQQWLTWLIDDINHGMKTKTISRSKAKLKLLTSKLSQISDVANRSFLMNFISQELEIISLSEARNEYVFYTVDPPYIGEKITKLAPALIFIIASLLGVFFSITALIFRNYLLGISPLCKNCANSGRIYLDTLTVSNKTM